VLRAFRLTLQLDPLANMVAGGLGKIHELKGSRLARFRKPNNSSNCSYGLVDAVQLDGDTDFLVLLQRANPLEGHSLFADVYGEAAIFGA
jgi:hypothetical protein